MSNLEVAIVGGGVSGLYAAWRLSTLPHPPRVAVFETSDKLGGRIDTAELPVPPPAAKAEFGAMRFLPSMQMVSGLLKYLDIQREPFPGLDVRETFLRGVQINSGGTNLPYRFAAGESGNLGALFEKILDGTVSGAFKLTGQQWFEVMRNAKFKGNELWQWGMENVGQEFISQEAYDYLCDASGLDSALLTANAATAIRGIVAVLPDFATQKVFRPVNGFGSLIEALRQRIAACPSCSIHTQRRVISVVRAREGRLTLDFAPAWGTSQDVPDQVTADKVIFALPRRALELIDLGRLFSDSFSGRTLLMKKLAGVNGIPAFKLSVVYEKPWWQGYTSTTQVRKGFKNGYAVTDLPLRQVFFGLGVGSTDAGNERVLLASYADTRAARFWTGQAQVSFSAIGGGGEGKVELTGPGNLSDAINQQLRALLQVDGSMPEPLSVGYMDWSADPFGGGWHEWVPGVDVITAIPEMRQPIPDAPVYVCGEAYSWFQSWIEGALISAERLLQEHFQLPWPTDWLPTDYDLGP